MNIKVEFCICLQLLFVIFKVVTGAITETDENNADHMNDTGEENQIDTDVSPLVLLFYAQNKGNLVVNHTDLETIKTTVFPKLSPLNYMELAGVALLYPASVEQENLKDVLLPQSITEHIETDKIHLTRKRNLKPVIFKNHDLSLYKIGYKVKKTPSDENNANTSENSMEKKLFEMMSKTQFESYSSEPYEIENFEVKYDFDLMMPIISNHLLFAHMHSNDYTRKCDDFALGLEVFQYKKKGFEITIFSNLSVAHSDYIPHQLAPFQDFKGEYETMCTCTYLNITLLHKDVVEGPLRRLEMLLRDIADITGLLFIETGTTKRALKVSKSDSGEETITFQRVSEISTSDPDQKTILIPTIFWKKITYFANNFELFSILMVIHNEETKRICDTNEIHEELGWPKSNPNETGIGTIYYCLVNEEIMYELGDYAGNLMNREEVIHPFNLNKMPFMSSLNILDVIKNAKDREGSI